MHRIQSKQQGQGLSEYLVIVGLIAVASIAAVGFLGGTVSILKSGRAIFNLGGNHFRVITKIFYVTQIVQIRFAGSHAEYDRVDAEII